MKANPALVLCAFVGATVLALAAVVPARAQLPDTLYFANRLTETVGAYDATTGATINSFLVGSGSNGPPTGLALSGNTLYVAYYQTNRVVTYDATTGTPLNPALVTGLNFPEGLALSGSHLFVADYHNNTVGEYDATTGAVLDASFITGLNAPDGLALSGDHLFVANYSNGVGEYDAATGAAINASFLGQLHALSGVAVSGNHLFVSYFDSSGGFKPLSGEFDATSGAVINASFINDNYLTSPGFLLVSPVPKPLTQTSVLLLSGACCIAFLRTRTCRIQKSWPCARGRSGSLGAWPSLRRSRSAATGAKSRALLLKTA